MREARPEVDAEAGARTMKAVRIHAFGGPEVLRVDDVPIPAPGPGTVLVSVAAAGVGPWDSWIRAGQSVLPQPLPLTPGSDIAGEVAAAWRRGSSPRSSASSWSCPPPASPSCWWSRMFGWR
jgi:hypothetical protein